ncbi:SoxR reducing system RseC family protein [Thermohalobacter berrensis]|uniref:Fis family transcriptional regulator n=1 Tax=Thermohalobacter berrensis TaxID=99594 RepID=A0A419TAZ2_9FIRM|nr:SoxR reducing system RseC family protein [Thermohalobacter berrensis]RKD34640.1 Fis family transcriptional regulator [Thermohalobacter berrensis]
MNQIGYIVSTKGNIAEVDIRRSSACGDKCGSCSGGCNAPKIRVKMKNTLGAEKGDLVEIKTKTNVVLKSAFIVYVVPLIIMILSIFAGINGFKSLGFSNYESLGFLTGLFSLGLSYIILKNIDKKIKEKNSLNFEMVKIINK